MNILRQPGTVSNASGFPYVDGALIGTDTTRDRSGFYTISWNSRNVPNGPHTIRADALDAAGNRGTRSVSVTVSN